MEAPIQKLQQSLCGPIAFWISLCAAMAAFGAIIFLGHMFGDFVRTCLYIALCISILAAAPGFATALGINGASVRGGGRLAFMAFDAQDSMRGAVLQTLYWSGPTGLLCLAVGWWVVGSKGRGQK